MEERRKQIEEKRVAEEKRVKELNVELNKELRHYDEEVQLSVLKKLMQPAVAKDAGESVELKVSEMTSVQGLLFSRLAKQALSEIIKQRVQGKARRITEEVRDIEMAKKMFPFAARDREWTIESLALQEAKVVRGKEIRALIEELEVERAAKLAAKSKADFLEAGLMLNQIWDLVAELDALLPGMLKPEEADDLAYRRQHAAYMEGSDAEDPALAGKTSNADKPLTMVT